jgi:hypothetical protein
MAHYEYEWHETIEAGETSGPKVPDYLEVTKGYDEKDNTNHIWQMIFGIRGQVYIYVELPTDIHRHGLPKLPKPTSEIRTISHFEEYMSDYNEPEFITEHFMMRPVTERINLSAYNPQNIDIKPWLNIFINKMVTERVGTEQYGVLATPVFPENAKVTEMLKAKWTETLQKLHKKQIPCRPISLLPVRAPAEAYP